MAFVMDHRHSSSGSDQSYHSATAEEDHWVHSKNIGAEGFGVVKVFVNHAGSHDLYELSLMMYYIIKARQSGFTVYRPRPHAILGNSILHCIT